MGLSLYEAQQKLGLCGKQPPHWSDFDTGKYLVDDPNPVRFSPKVADVVEVFLPPIQTIPETEIPQSSEEYAAVLGLVVQIAQESSESQMALAAKMESIDGALNEFMLRNQRQGEEIAKLQSRIDRMQKSNTQRFSRLGARVTTVEKDAKTILANMVQKVKTIVLPGIK